MLHCKCLYPEFQSLFIKGLLRWKGYRQFHIRLKLSQRYIIILIILNLSLIIPMPQIPNHIFSYYSDCWKVGSNISYLWFIFVFYSRTVLEPNYHENTQKYVIYRCSQPLFPGTFLQNSEGEQISERIFFTKLFVFVYHFWFIPPIISAPRQSVFSLSLLNFSSYPYL